MYTLIIGNINCNNFGSLRVIAGDFGYAGSISMVDEETRRIQLRVVNDEERRDAEQMIGRYAMAGFSIAMKP